MTTPERVVFDCNVLFQALTSPFGPAARLLELASSRDILLFVAGFIADISSFATCVDSVPHIFDFGRDPDDAHYSLKFRFTPYPIIQSPASLRTWTGRQNRPQSLLGSRH
jgi:hypothetical protein